MLARGQLHLQVAVERLCDAEQGVDPWWAPTTLQPGDRGLGRPDELRELTLRQASRGAALGDFAGNRGEEPAFLGSRQSRPETLDRQWRPFVVSHVCDYSEIAIAVKQAAS